MAEPRMMVKDIGVRFGAFQALGGVNIAIMPGKLHSIIGPNGAGKTTLFNVLTGQLRPSEGRVWLGAREITRTSWTSDRETIRASVMPSTKYSGSCERLPRGSTARPGAGRAWLTRAASR